jgi:hypothetical protein
MTIPDKIALRKRLVNKRDELQIQITSLYEEMKSDILQEFIELGIFNEKWSAHQDTTAFSMCAEFISLTHFDLRKRCIELGETYGITYLDLGYEAMLTIPIMTINFKNNSKIKPFVENYKIHISLNFFDEKINKLEQQKARFVV